MNLVDPKLTVEGNDMVMRRRKSGSSRALEFCSRLEKSETPSTFLLFRLKSIA